MCVVFVQNNSETVYEDGIAIEAQMEQCEEIVIKYENDDSLIDRFLSKIESIVHTNFKNIKDIRFVHNNNINGIRFHRRAVKIMNAIYINRVISSLVLSHSTVDHKLEEISNYLGNK